MADNYVQRGLGEAELILEELCSASDPADQRRLQFQLIDLLRDPNNAIRQGVLLLMKRLGTGMNQSLMDSLLRPAEAYTDGAILALADLNRWSCDEIKREAVSAIEPFLADQSSELNRAAMFALRILNTRKAQLTMMAALVRGGANEGLVELSWTRDAGLVPFVLERSCGGELSSKADIPFYVANLVDADWVAEHLLRVDTLLIAERFGYIDQTVAQRLRGRACDTSIAAIRRLLERIGIVSGELLELFLVATDQNDLLCRWEERAREIAKYLLPDDLIVKSGIDPVGLGADSEDRLSRHLLFAGLRLADTWSFEAKLELSPFQSKAQSQVAGGFYFKSFEVFEDAYLSKAMQAGSSLLESDSAPKELRKVLLPYIVLNYALIGAETRADESMETHYLFESRWRALVKILEVVEGRIQVRGVYASFVESPRSADLSDRSDVNNFIEHLRATDNGHLMRFNLLDVNLVRRVDDFMESAPSRDGWSELSFGAQSALRVCAYDLMKSDRCDEIETAWLAEFNAVFDEEASYVGVLPSLGIEIQSTSVPENLTFAWKESLECFGIPSPRRPEFHHIVEPALRPMYSPRACLLLLRTLHGWGIHESYDRGSALHYSVAGDLGDEAKYLALGLRSFVTEKPKRELTESDWYRNVARVMSKGLLHRNPDSVAARLGEGRPVCHTEIRVLRLQNDPDGSGRLDPACDVFIPGGQGLAAAAFADLDPNGDSGLAKIWRGYREEIRTLYLDPHFGQAGVVDANWYEATGDPEDARLVRALPIVQSFVEARKFLQEHPGRTEELRSRANELFCRSAREVLGYLKSQTFDVSG